MIWCFRVTRTAIFGVVLSGLLHCAGAAAADGKAYRYVDEKGKVVYSQTPPPAGTGVKKLDLRPAYRGLGGVAEPVSPYGESRGPYVDRQEQYREALRQRQQQEEEARAKRRAELEAECNRNRGTDCSDPEALRYIESTKIPGGRRH